jgi:tRNA (cmo5U34)-methyltransferase
MKKNKNKSGDNINAKFSDWTFKRNVYKNFDKHINKSIPLYAQTHQLYLHLSDFFLQDKSKIIDLGCSTGIYLNKLFERHGKNSKKLKFIGIDSAKEMIKYCKKKNKKNINFFNENILNYNLSNTCIISSLYTIQFISPKKRQALINKIFKSLNWGGAFFMAEKVRGPNARFQDIFNQIYVEYKLSKGYSAEEIINKTNALKSVLEPFSSSGNLQMLKRAGFQDINVVFKYSCFEGYLAIK